MYLKDMYIALNIPGTMQNMLGQKRLMNSFSGQISEILMRQAGIFFFIIIFYY